MVGRLIDQNARSELEMTLVLSVFFSAKANATVSLDTTIDRFKAAIVNQRLA